MLWIKTIPEMRDLVARWRKNGESVGLVPTMGFFHQGHLALMKKARQENEEVVVSLFVNPTQFGPGEDFEQYPRNRERDEKIAEEAGVDAVFNPAAVEMYDREFQTFVDLTELPQGLCGAARPGHFRGVATVVTKLFNIVQPERAYFGEKDAQQLRVIKRMAVDLNIPVDIRAVPTVREEDGLAMSSRNTYLSPEERQAALVLSKSLFFAKAQVETGERNSERLKEKMKELITGEPLVSLEYLEIRASDTLRPVSIIAEEVLIALAARAGKTRLIDNITINPEGRR